MDPVTTRFKRKYYNLFWLLQGRDCDKWNSRNHGPVLWLPSDCHILCGRWRFWYIGDAPSSYDEYQHHSFWAVILSSVSIGQPMRPQLPHGLPCLFNRDIDSTMGYEHKVRLSQSVVPVQQKLRHLPLAFRQKDYRAQDAGATGQYLTNRHIRISLTPYSGLEREWQHKHVRWLKKA